MFCSIFITYAFSTNYSEIGQCSCPSGFELVRDGECRGSVANMTLTVDVAISTIIAKCNEIQGQPIIIHDDDVSCCNYQISQHFFAASELLGRASRSERQASTSLG